MVRVKLKTQEEDISQNLFPENQYCPKIEY